jgi:cytochrome c nitrite reductase small subunit
MVERRIRLAICLSLGVIAGTGLFTFTYAEGVSYLSDDPEACANCHVMVDHHEAWQRGSHHAVAVCNDCHAPESLIPKYAVKAINGWNHSVAFTTGEFADPFQITPMNVRVAEQSCRRCHASLVHAIDPGAGELSCLRCHAGVGH